MLTTLNTLILRNLFLIAAVEIIDLPNAGCVLVVPTNSLLNLGNVVVSAIWTRKMKTFVHRIDFDGDGAISGKDFNDMVDRFADREGFSPTEKETAMQGFRDLFDTFTQAAGTKDDVLLTADLLTDSMKMHRDGLAFRQLVGIILNSLLSHMKIDQEGYLSYPEYRRFYENFGFTNVLFTTASFAQIDSDHDDKISVGDFSDAVINYMCSDDDDSTAFFGLLF